MKILCFAKAREVVGSKEIQLSISRPLALKEIIHLLIQMHPQLENIIPSCSFAVDLEYADISSSKTFTSENEIAIICPVSGG
jgi:molybdopterin converting factor small subunit